MIKLIPALTILLLTCVISVYTTVSRCNAKNINNAGYTIRVTNGDLSQIRTRDTTRLNNLKVSIPKASAEIVKSNYK